MRTGLWCVKTWWKGSKIKRGVLCPSFFARPKVKRAHTFLALGRVFLSCAAVMLLPFATTGQKRHLSCSCQCFIAVPASSPWIASGEAKLPPVEQQLRLRLVACRTAPEPRLLSHNTISKHRTVPAATTPAASAAAAPAGGSSMTTSAVDEGAVAAASAAYPKPASFTPAYGTAGFRAEASLLPSTVFRCGMLIGLRARCTGQVRSPRCVWGRVAGCQRMGASNGCGSGPQQTD